MDIYMILQQFNIIKLLNTVFPAGIGELIVLICWIGFFFLLGVIAIVFALTRELTITNTRARVTMEEIGVLVFPGGATKELILPKRTGEFTYKMGEQEARWTISPDEWMTKSNGVRYTFLHPAIPHNVSLNNLVKILMSANTKIYRRSDGTQEEVFDYIPIQNLTWTAFDQGSKIYTIAQALSKDLIDPNKKLTTAAIAISLILAVGIAGAIIFIVLPHPAATTTEVITQAVTTTLPPLSGIH